MSSIGETEISALLSAWKKGDTDARDALFERVYSELRQISTALLRVERNISLSTGDLVNEAALKLMQIDSVDWVDRSHFLALAAKAMRRALIDHARKKNTNKRKHDKITLITGIGGGGSDKIALDALEKALIRLHVVDPDLAEIVEFRYFGGMTLEEIGVVKGMSVSTVKRNWRAARAWLLECLSN